MILFNLNEEVFAVQEFADHVLVSSEKKTYKAKYVILATPSYVANKLYSPISQIEKDLMSSAYGKIISVVCKTNKRWWDDEKLKGLYSMSFPDREASILGSILFLSAIPNRVPDDNEVLQIFLSEKGSEKLFNFSKEVIISAFKREIDVYLNGFSSSLEDYKIKKWYGGMVNVPVGKAKLIKSYRELISEKFKEANSRVILAGDYVNIPGLEGAYSSGLWAAEKIENAMK
ncbi:MAG: FAD-dependent oxidoreductase [Pseudomonadota bacterium]